MDNITLVIMLAFVFEGLIWSAIAFGFLYLYAVKLKYFPTLETLKAQQLLRQAEKAEDDRKYDETLREIAESQKKRKEQIPDEPEAITHTANAAIQTEAVSEDETPAFDELMDLLEMGIPDEELKTAKSEVEGIIQGK